MFNLLLPLGMKGLTAKVNCYISSKYLCISYNDFDSPLKINESFGSQNYYKTYSFKNRTIQAPMKMYGFRNILF